MNLRDDLQRAIELMREGQARTAAAMLREIIAEPELDDHARATAYVWLAESRPERGFKIDCLQRALDHEPDNAQVREMLERLRVEASPETNSSQSVRIDVTPTVVGIRGGPNGLGSGFFVDQRGLVATTGYVTGSEHAVEVSLVECRDDGRTRRAPLPGQRPCADRDTDANRELR